MISEQAIMDAIRAYANTKEGARYILSQAPELKNTIKDIAKELRKDIINAYNSATSSNANPIDVRRIHVNTVRADDTAEGWVIDISFTGGVLERESLLNQIGGRTGTGVYDIFGLLTNGYPLIKRTAGIWEGRNDNKPIRNKRVRSPNSFISDTIESFKSRHPGVEVRYPTLWGGNDNGIL